MSDPNINKYKQVNKQMWNEYVAIHSRSTFYGLKEFKEGVNKLNPLELGEVGDVKGKSLLHLQCHFGMDTLSWARLGANVTGMDFSEEGIALACSLAEELKIPSRFICCDLYDLPNHLNETFDIVFTSYGVLTWLPDIARWAQIAASCVKPGGFFYIAEMHPFAAVFDYQAMELRYRYPYFDKEALSFEVEGSYADHNAEVTVKNDFEWNHTLGEIITSLINAGLQIEFLHEFPFTVFEQLPFLEHDGKGIWNFPGEGKPPIPLMFSLRAIKPAIK
ncbi:MAG: methyltransferase type 11 [Chloroflexi bacterium]|nr:MAG: methyltransferase type 11 [Chloroflexota bacterium]